MFVSKSLSVNQKGHLTIGGVDTIELAQQYGTPLYVMDEDCIRENCRLFQQAINDCYQGNGMVCYASKAFSCKEIYRIMKSEGMGIDVVSLGELYTALQAGFAASKICFHGNNKTKEELLYALQHGVGRIVVDNITELQTLNQLAKQQKVKQRVLLRIKPGIDAHTHEFIRTGQIDSKFGFALETGEAMKAVLLALTLDGLQLVGLHCHIGSQILETEPFSLAAEVMLAFIHDVKEKTKVELCELNLGGGYGIQYQVDADDPISYFDYMQCIARTIKDKTVQYGLKPPFILLEPGRSIVGPAGITLYRVGTIKKIPNIRTYVSVDGGMTDNPRYALYQSKYQIVVANKANKPYSEKVTIAGKCCESGDLIGENMFSQKIEVDDVLAVMATGAYNYSMASNYNRICRPAVVMVKNGTSRIVVQREMLEDIIRNDI